VDAVPTQGTGPGTEEPEDGDADTGADAPVPESPPARHLGLVLAVAAVTLAIDQLTKWWALETLATRPPIELIGSLQLNLAFNEGAAFSFGDGRNLGPFIAVLALVVVVFLVRNQATTTRLGAATAGLIAGGVLGNVTDRAFRAGDGFFGGAVVDFIDVQWYPVFNIADSSICVGAVLFILVGLRKPAAPT
jgi:signal peptidase II